MKLTGTVQNITKSPSVKKQIISGHSAGCLNSRGFPLRLSSSNCITSGISGFKNPADQLLHDLPDRFVY